MRVYYCNIYYLFRRSNQIHLLTDLSYDLWFGLRSPSSKALLIDALI
jgi:hypothetical protein